MTTRSTGERVKLVVYLASFLLHGGLWQGVRSLEPPPPPAPPPIKITMREVPPPPPDDPPPPEPEPPPPEPAAPAEAAPTPTPPPPQPTPSKPKKQKPAAPTPAADPPSSAPPDFGVQMQGGTGPGGAAVPAGDPGGSSSSPPPRERVEARARKLDSKPKPVDDACADPEVRPTPLEIPQPPYSDAARAAGVEGKVRVQLSISADGSVSAVKVVAPLHRDLDEAARVAMKAAKFTPATRCGKPVATTLTISVKFTL